MQLPKLMDLSRLRYFAFGVETPPKSKVYLEDSAVYGVSTFKNLLTDTTAPPSYQISNEALEAFTAKFSRCEIVRFNGGVEEWPELRRRDNGDSSDDESKRREELGLDSEDENESDEIEELSGDERNDNENPE
ncbi:hypothetical protein Ocin01_07027 [Orchesella cincta]|uniref:Uncharacterized protein n=1 Tax=Orchesella cincta TaxID=48709 RepID=A0A1D2N3Z7_ORCCI|nr:hypothetical protein Ocin01_07027 [Orchesella cincta]